MLHLLLVWTQWRDRGINYIRLWLRRQCLNRIYNKILPDLSFETMHHFCSDRLSWSNNWITSYYNKIHVPCHKFKLRVGRCFTRWCRWVNWSSSSPGCLPDAEGKSYRSVRVTVSLSMATERLRLAETRFPASTLIIYHPLQQTRGCNH